MLASRRIAELTIFAAPRRRWPEVVASPIAALRGDDFTAACPRGLVQRYLSLPIRPRAVADLATIA